VTSPALNVIALAVKSALVSPLCTVYVPVSVRPSALAVNTTWRSVAPVSRVTVTKDPAVIVSDAVAVMLIVVPNL
jgi:hypothetical protein